MWCDFALYICRQSFEYSWSLAHPQLWAVLPVAGGELEVLGKNTVHSQ